jgi:peptide/nickel transport system substrate-binding protein
VNTVAPRHWRRLVALLVPLAVIAAACGGGGGGGGGDSSPTTGGGTATTAAAGKPQTGGKVVYAQEADDGGGLCLPEAQLDISGINYARTIYDTLTAPNDKGEYVPFLAETVTPNADFTSWVIKLRSGIKFHDGTDLDAQIVKDNLDAYRGAYMKTGPDGTALRKPQLFVFVFGNIKDITVQDAQTLTIDTTVPWPALPAYLWSSNRLGIMARAQLDDPTNCAKNLIGTGPFVLKDWVVNDHFDATKNPNYWQKDADGVQLPYLDEIEFKPLPDGQQRINSVVSNTVQIEATSSALDIEQLRALADQKKVTLTESDKFAEVNYVMLNATKPPFDNIHARLALAYATDREQLNQVRAHDILTVASGPFAPGSVGYLEDAGFPAYDLDKAKSEVAAYKADTGQDLSFTLGGTAGDPEGVQTQEYLKGVWEEAGMSVDLNQIEQAQYINTAIARDFQAFGWRNHPGSDADTQYVWWHCDNGAAAPAACDNPVNFGGFNDPAINTDLQNGRSDLDPATRVKDYESLNQEFSKQVWNLWTSWALWGIATTPNIHGIMGPNLPDGSPPFPGLATGNPMTTIWIEQ